MVGVGLVGPEDHLDEPLGIDAVTGRRCRDSSERRVDEDTTEVEDHR